MDLLEGIRSRRSIRGFGQGEVAPSELMTILEAAMRAPSAGNRQPWEFVVIRERPSKLALAAAAYGQNFIADASLCIVVCANSEKSAKIYGDRGRYLYSIQDTAAATENILLAAHSLNLGACWIGAFDEDVVTEVIKAPKGIRPVAIVPLGKAAEEPTMTPRTPLRTIVHAETFT